MLPISLANIQHIPTVTALSKLHRQPGKISQGTLTLEIPKILASSAGLDPERVNAQQFGQVQLLSS